MFITTKRTKLIRLREVLVARQDVFRRTIAAKITISPIEDHTFTFRASWPLSDDIDHHFERRFTLVEAGLRRCVVIRQLMQDLLKERGIT